MKQHNYIQNLLTADLVSKIFSTVVSEADEVIGMIDRKKLSFSKKNRSEFISSICENAFADCITKYTKTFATKASCDAEPDVMIGRTKIPLEIKVTSTDSAWTGGGFSKRESSYILVSWDGVDYTSYFVALCYLLESDWASGGENYYGTCYKKKELILEPTYKPLMGSLVRKGDKVIKMVREKVQPIE